MDNEPENLVLEYLRAMRTDIAAIKDDIREVKNRVTMLEAGQATIIQQLGHVSGSIAQQQVSFDRFGERVERIEHRLELSAV